MPEKAEAPVVPSGWDVKNSLEKRVAALETQVQGLAPLHELVNHITQIKRVFGQ